MGDEKWEWVQGYEGVYQVSDMGRVRSYNGFGRMPKIQSTPRLITPCMDGRGYFNFTVRKNGKQKVLLIHIEMAKSFLENPNKHKLVRHLDDVKGNNLLSNLAWGTYAENREDGIRNGRHFHKPGVCPAKAKLTEEDVVFIMKSSEKNTTIGRRLGVTESTISKVRNGRGWNKITNLPYLK